jgi:hypothetical protein
MKNFLSDLWHDLREKRLWPVAVVLLAALVAVPVVLSKPSEEPPPAPPATDARSAPEPRDLKGLATVKLEATDTGTGSSLDTFDPSNPFRPPRKVLQGAQEADTAAGSDSGPGSAAASDGDAGSGGSTGGSVTIGGGGDSGPGETGTGDTGGGDTGGGGDTTTTTTQYAYVADVTFRSDGRTRKIKGMERLDMLPSETSPLLLFLGVSPSGGNAVFLVDSTLDAAGEGRCKPSRSDCAFLYLGAGSEHEFVNDDGESYQLKVDEIRKVKVGTKPAASSSKKGAAAKAAIGAPETRRRFVPPFLADLVSVSSTTGGDSDNNEDRR